MVCILDVFEACVGQDVFSGDYFTCDVAPQGLLCCVCFNGWTLIKVSLLSDVAYASHLFCSHESKIQCLCSNCIKFFCFLWTHSCHFDLSSYTFQYSCHWLQSRYTPLPDIENCKISFDILCGLSVGIWLQYSTIYTTEPL